MSPPDLDSTLLAESFPRVSGDEPHQIDLSLKQVAFSPRERG